MDNGWIPVGDKLPAQYETVITFIEYASETGKKCHEVCGNFYFNGENWVEEEVGDVEENAIKVLYWMPMPEPPILREPKAIGIT